MFSLEALANAMSLLQQLWQTAPINGTCEGLSKPLPVVFKLLGISTFC